MLNHKWFDGFERKMENIVSIYDTIKGISRAIHTAVM
jgi:hypothetical protein